MLKIKLLLVFLLISQSSFSLLVSDEKKISIASEKYDYGYYQECIVILNKYTSSNQFSKDPERSSDAFGIKSASYFQMADYGLYEKTIAEWKGLLNNGLIDSIKVICQFKLAQTLLEVGNLKECDSLLAVISGKGNHKFNSDLLIVKSGLLVKQGFINDAGKILSTQISERRNNLNKIAWKKSYLTYFDSYKKVYAEIVCQKIKVFIIQGEIDSAKVLLTVHKTWLDENLPAKFFYRELDVLGGELELTRDNFHESYLSFKKAYERDGFADGDYQKINLLSIIIQLSDKLGFTDQSQKLSRRLHMLAYVSAGKQEPFQYAFEKTVMQIFVEDNNFSKAKTRYDDYSKAFKNLPNWYPVKLSFAKVEADLLLYQSGLNKSKSLDSIMNVYNSNLGQGHEFEARLLLEKISYNINYGTVFSDIEKDLARLNEVFISKGYGGNYLLQYFDLNGNYHLLSDDFKLSKEFAEKAYNYSVKLYGVSSDKRVYYRAVYLKSLLSAGFYKEFYSQFDEFKKYFSSVNWSDNEEKRKSYLVVSDIYKLIGEKDESKSELISIVNEMGESGKENIYAKARTESQLAYIYDQTGNLFKSEKLIKKSITEKKSLLEENSVAFIEDLFFLADLELQKGVYNDAENHLEQTAGIISNAYGNNGLLYAEYLKLHADYCIAIGDYKRGDEYIVKSQKIVVGKLGKTDLHNVGLLVRKAYVLSQNSIEDMDKDKITSLYKEALLILSKTIGKENVLYMDVLKKNAHYLIKTHQLAKADSILSVVEAYWKNRLGNENHELLEVFLLKGDISYEKGNYENANTHYTNVKTIASSIYGTANTYYTRAYARQAKVAYMLNKPEVALSIMENLLPRYLNFVSKNFPSLSFREKTKYWNNMKDEFEFYTFLILNNKDLATKYSKEIYNTVISTKAILLSNSIKIRETILASKDSVLIQAYNEWIDLKEYYTSVSSLSRSELEEQKIDLRAIEADIEKKEKNLSNKSELFKNEDRMSNASFRDVAAILSDNEYAVELVRYRNFYKTFTDTINYAALIVKKGAVTPEVVIFPHSNEFEAGGLKYARNSARFQIKDKRSYKLFWSPIQNKIPDGSTVYFSSEGAYNQFNLEMLCDSTNKYLLERIELVQVTNTKELLRALYKSKQKNQTQSAEMVLCGNPDFCVDDNVQYQIKVADLPGTAKEIDGLAGLLISNQMKVTKVTGKDLTEEEVKALNSPKVFHIATHGYYSQSKSGDEESNSMLNSGLLLSEAGDILGTESHVNSKDGILTAYEAMNLKLDNTDLVVLSACETGLGEVHAGEGVYGLQRSFLIAGSKAIIISLYKVNDEVTQKLMMEFYSNWVATKDIRKSFIEAKKKIKTEYPDAPIYWGAFVLIEGQPKLKRVGTGAVAGL